ncbi:MAG: Ribonuclease HII [Candidatus Tokpelaia hoelldobleri]|uniref:Ribonuclease HII n=1 Tax=Candidatus Tokpelaia hoelldobleri TaxID=1902579 RepID=A0A1U9JTA1_9HYPH|nr:MAG: Ribonuclease HII [Candidatus Tokpelaia hoelldoblerii]
MRAPSRSPSLFVLPEKPDFSGELRLMEQGIVHVAGVDEAGRGPLAGPVVAAAVVFAADNLPQGLDDSKRLPPARRAELYENILSRAVAVSVASISARAIDGSDIRKAALAAMRRAVAGLSVSAGYVLVDGRDVPPGLPCLAEAWIKGDQRSLSIAAASIIAKVLRDRMMERAGNIYPAYGFARHAGYGTAVHRRAIEEQGAIAGLHRFTFAPLKNMHIEDTP